MCVTLCVHVCVCRVACIRTYMDACRAAGLFGVEYYVCTGMNVELYVCVCMVMCVELYACECTWMWVELDVCE